MSNHNDPESLSADVLAAVTGGGLGWLKPLAKFGGKKVLGPVGWAWSAYDGTSAFIDARKHGKSVGASLWEGAKSAVI
jgi:hypothetical protein